MGGCSSSRGGLCTTHPRREAAPHPRSPFPLPPSTPFRLGPCVGDGSRDGLAAYSCMAAGRAGARAQLANLEQMCVDVGNALLSLEAALDAPRDPKAIDEQLSAALRTTTALHLKVPTPSRSRCHSHDWPCYCTFAQRES